MSRRAGISPIIIGNDGFSCVVVSGISEILSSVLELTIGVDVTVNDTDDSGIGVEVGLGTIVGNGIAGSSGPSTSK
jgi:hypothetical protein